MDTKTEFRQLLSAAGLSQRQAGIALGCTYRTVQYWLCPSSHLQPPAMALLALRWLISQR